MKINQRIQETIRENEKQFMIRPEFVKLQDFYWEMQKKGIAKKQEYKTVPIDSIGHYLNQK